MTLSCTLPGMAMLPPFCLPLRLSSCHVAQRGTGFFFRSSRLYSFHAEKGSGGGGALPPKPSLVWHRSWGHPWNLPWYGVARRGASHFRRTELKSLPAAPQVIAVPSSHHCSYFWVGQVVRGQPMCSVVVCQKATPLHAWSITVSALKLSKLQQVSRGKHQPSWLKTMAQPH